ncbi:GNAT family N-acetyltransferase [Ancylobacter sp. 6x-1]|uniref:GNAT family N-acetyltransferase n=1 Tax=Ancylobacter crimeensis TaxID=2579147 RepID=A0ABT0DC47_9HYPH|nr:GNAT family N-acetyltransferase [Ancylobacter crimeensis]MCK0197519.1 GNAT family N-acetyltransferase [Ancylobacter crimeensis]
MGTLLIETRRARPADAAELAEIHDSAWRGAYRGVIPGSDLEKMIQRRGPAWWQSALSRGSRVLVLTLGDSLVGYANFGRNRARSLPFEGEIYELYLKPEYQGLGFGRRLFRDARKELSTAGFEGLAIWALADNEPAVGFYRALGGRAVARSSENFGGRTLDKIAFGWHG